MTVAAPAMPPLSQLLEELARTKPDRKWAVCDYLDGPGFVAWLKRVGYSDGQDSAIKRWAKGEDASIHAADSRVTKLGLHLDYIPDDLWKDRG